MRSWLNALLEVSRICYACTVRGIFIYVPEATALVVKEVIFLKSNYLGTKHILIVFSLSPFLNKRKLIVVFIAIHSGLHLLTDFFLYLLSFPK